MDEFVFLTYLWFIPHRNWINRMKGKVSLFSKWKKKKKSMKYHRIVGKEGEEEKEGRSVKIGEGERQSIV